MKKNDFIDRVGLSKTLGLMFLCFFFSYCVQAAPAVQNEIMKWHLLELSFEGPELSEQSTPNPFLDFRLDVTFISPTAKKYKVPGFYYADGNAQNTSVSSGNKWAVRFSPNEVGLWKYMVSFVQENNIAIKLNGGNSAGWFDGTEGEFSVLKSDISKTAKDFRGKGKLEYVGEHYLQFQEDKSYFLKGGANSPEIFLEYSEFDNTPSERTYSEHVQHWLIGDPTWKSDQGKGLIGMVNYLSSLNNNVFYFLTMNYKGDGKKAWPWVNTSDIYRYDISKLEQWHTVFSHMQTKGIMTHFVLSETENESFFEWEENKVHGGFANSRKIYYREMFARFGYLLATTWNIGEESGWVDPSGDNEHQKAITTKQRKAFAQYINQLSYYNENIVVHNGPSEDYHIFDKLNDNILGDSAYTGPSLQGDYLSKKVYRDVLKYRELSAASSKKWVISMDEAYINRFAKNLDTWRIDNVWATLMAGGAGIEFYLGGGGDLRDQNIIPYENFYKTMSDALVFFHESVPFWQLTPDETFHPEAWTLKQDGQFYLFYFKSGVSHRIKNMINLPEQSYSIEWFNPRENTYQKGSIKTVKGGNITTLGVPPNTENKDWVCIVKVIDISNTHSTKTAK